MFSPFFYLFTLLSFHFFLFPFPLFFFVCHFFLLSSPFIDFQSPSCSFIASPLLSSLPLITLFPFTFTPFLLSFLLSSTSLPPFLLTFIIALLSSYPLVFFPLHSLFSLLPLLSFLYSPKSSLQAHPSLDFLLVPFFLRRSAHSLTRLLQDASSAPVPEPERSQDSAGGPQHTQLSRQGVCGGQRDSVPARVAAHLRRLWWGEPRHPDPAGGAGDDQEAHQIWELVGRMHCRVYIWFPEWQSDIFLI